MPARNAATSAKISVPSLLGIRTKVPQLLVQKFPVTGVRP